MRGPSIRTKYDVRRLWRCPLCLQERLLPQTETSVRCSCTAAGMQMQLVEKQRYARPAPPPLDLVMTEADCDPEPVPEPVTERIKEAASVPPLATSGSREGKTESIDFSDAVPGQNDHANTQSPDVDRQRSTEVPPGEINDAV